MRARLLVLSWALLVAGVLCLQAQPFSTFPPGVFSNRAALSPGSVAASTFDPSKKGTDITLSGANLIADNTANTSTWSTVLGTSSKTTGKFYIEFLQGAYNLGGTSTDNILYGFTQNNMANFNQPITGSGDGGLLELVMVDQVLEEVAR